MLAIYIYHVCLCQLWGVAHANMTKPFPFYAWHSCGDCYICVKWSRLPLEMLNSGLLHCHKAVDHH